MSIDVRVKLEGAGLNVDDFATGVAETFLKGVGVIAQNAKSHWIDLAGRRLHTSRGDYVAGLQKPDSFTAIKSGSNVIYEIILVGKMPNNFEFGMASFDMKQVRPGWLGGGKAKTAADGHKYITIPFRHSTSSNSRLGYSGQAKAAQLQNELRKVVKQYGLNRMVSAAGVPRQGSVARAGATVTSGRGRAATTRPIHPFLRNLTRVQKVHDSGKVQGQLLSWRIMSENSEPGSWIHPGITAANILPEVERFVHNELDSLIDRMFGVRK
jgi:hypothetical protein